MMSGPMSQKNLLFLLIDSFISVQLQKNELLKMLGNVSVTLSGFLKEATKDIKTAKNHVSNVIWNTAELCTVGLRK